MSQGCFLRATMRMPLWWSRRSAAVWTQLSQGTRRIIPLLPLPYICRTTFSRFCPPRVNDHYLTTILKKCRGANIFKTSRRVCLVLNTCAKAHKHAQNKVFSNTPENSDVSGAQSSAIVSKSCASWLLRQFGGKSTAPLTTV